MEYDAPVLLECISMRWLVLCYILSLNQHGFRVKVEIYVPSELSMRHART